jgi:hypothetical protein
MGKKGLGPFGCMYMLPHLKNLGRALNSNHVIIYNFQSWVSNIWAPPVLKGLTKGITNYNML